jgi:micrococcal nuclease
MKRVVPIAILLLAVLPAMAGQTWTGRCVAVTDGDTIRVLRNRETVKIRLHGIDCQEKRQPFGTRAKLFTSDLVFGKTITVDAAGTDRYGRTIARVFVGSTNVNHELVKAGMAWWYRKYAPDDQELERLESEARRAHRGLWSDLNPMAPWEWRRRSRR